MYKIVITNNERAIVGRISNISKVLGVSEETIRRWCRKKMIKLVRGWKVYTDIEYIV